MKVILVKFIENILEQKQRLGFSRTHFHVALFYSSSITLTVLYRGGLSGFIAVHKENNTTINK